MPVNAPPDDSPVSTFVGRVRRVDPADQEEIAATVISAAFPQFASLSDLMPGETPSYQRPRRRFAGDTTLPRGCYYSVCSPDTDDDHGTLANELAAYGDPPLTGAVEIDDLAFPLWTHKLPVQQQLMFGRNSTQVGGEGTNRLAIVFHSVVKQNEDSFFDRLVASLRRSRRGGIGGVHRISETPLPDGRRMLMQGVYLYYRTQTIEVPQVLDLRRKPAQDFLIALTQSGGLGFSLPRCEYPISLLLQVLLTSEFGGSALTDRIGHWLRANGANGLVFPAARSDSFLRVRSGVTEDWRHWNFVDYRAAPRPSVLESTSPIAIEGIMPPGSHIELPAAPELHGSFRVDGVHSFYVGIRSKWARENFPTL